MVSKLLRPLVILLFIGFAHASVAQTYLPNGKAPKDVFGEVVQCNHGDFVVFKKPEASHEGLLRLTTSPAPSSGHVFIPATIQFKMKNRRFDTMKVDSSMYVLRINGRGRGTATWKVNTSEAPPTDPFSENQTPKSAALNSISLDCHFEPNYPTPTGFSAGN